MSSACPCLCFFSHHSSYLCGYLQNWTLSARACYSCVLLQVVLFNGQRQVCCIEQCSVLSNVNESPYAGCCQFAMCSGVCRAPSSYGCVLGFRTPQPGGYFLLTFTQFRKLAWRHAARVPYPYLPSKCLAASANIPKLHQFGQQLLESCRSQNC